jgi:RND superfamily putative drug exporter
MALSTRGLAYASARHPWRVIGIWVLALVASFGLIGALLSDALTNEADVTSDPESERGQALIEELRGPFRVNEALVVESPTLKVDDPEFRAYVEKLHADIAALGPEYIERSTTFYASGDPTMVSSDRTATLIPIVMAGDIDQATKNIGDIHAIIEGANGSDRFHTYIAGFASVSEDFNKALEKDLQRSEFGTLPIALLILVAVFGALVAALVPLGLAFVAIIAAIALTAIIGQQFQFTFFVTNMILMMGLAVGIDYSLFIVSRFREERARGLEKNDAIATAASTAGRAVLFSGLTVVVALTGLLIVPQTIFRSLSGGAILVVLASVAASLTLLPAVLGLLGDRVNKGRIPLVQKAQQAFNEEAPGGFWDRVAHTVMARPIVSVIVGTTFLIAAAVPYFDIELGFAGVSTLPDNFASKQGFLKVQEKFAGGDVYPAEIVIQGDIDSPTVQGGIERLKGIVAQDSVFGPSQMETNEAGDLGVLSISLAADPNARLATDAIERLREDYIPEAFNGVDAEVLVAGLAAENFDGYEMTRQYLPIVVAFVLTLSFVLLTLVFRSIVVPAKAIVMNLLSVGAAYGLIVLFNQKGFLNEITGFQQVEAIEAWLPLFLFSILFGLSMDYHVFLLSRIKERYDQTGDNTGAVAFGLRSTGRLITGAALIMVAVFGGFALGDLVMFQQMGFGLGVAVFIDATVIRSVLVPASMKLLGRWNWYLPPVLQWLPHVGIEGSHAAPPPRGLATEPTAGGG